MEAAVVMDTHAQEKRYAGVGGCAPAAQSDLHLVFPDRRTRPIDGLARHGQERRTDDAIGWAVPAPTLVSPRN